MKEKIIQRQVIQWFRLQYPNYSKLLIAVPNGGSRNSLEAVELKRQGVQAGVADLLLLIPKGGFGCLGLELKNEKNKQTLKQMEWQSDFEMFNKYVVCRSLYEFIDEIEKYLEL